MHRVDGIGFCASLAVLASFCMTTILPLRILALASNVLFILYGVLGNIYPVLLLHVVLLPINLIKLHQFWARSHRAKVENSGRSVEAEDDR